MQRKFQKAAWVVIVCLGLYIIYRGLFIAKENHFLQKIPGMDRLERTLETLAVKTHVPGLTFAYQGTREPRNLAQVVLDEVFPLYSYAEKAAEGMPDIESRLEYELLVEADEKKESRQETAKTDDPGGRMEAGVDGKNGGQKADDLAGTEDKSEDRTEHPSGDGKGVKERQEKEGAAGLGDRIEAKDPDREPVEVYAKEEFDSYDALLNRFFAVDPSAAPLESLLDYDLLMSKNLALAEVTKEPQILIYHTHSQEAFLDSVEGDVNDTIVGVGDYLTKILTEAYGFAVLHHTKTYDLVDGVLDRNRAYTLAAPDILQILEEHPSIEVIIDLHRDGVDGYKFVKEIDGKPTAQIMFFNGLSRTAEQGEIAYLPNPYIEDNLAFSFQLQLKAAQYYPGWTRNIYLSSLRYNLHMRPKSLLIEAGTQLNTVEEEKNAMELLADILNQVLRGK